MIFPPKDSLVVRAPLGLLFTFSHEWLLVNCSTGMVKQRKEEEFERHLTAKIRVLMVRISALYSPAKTCEPS